jgi:hypothetical protein
MINRNKFTTSLVPKAYRKTRHRAPTPSRRGHTKGKSSTFPEEDTGTRDLLDSNHRVISYKIKILGNIWYIEF